MLLLRGVIEAFALHCTLILPTGTVCVFEMLTSEFFFYETLTNDVVSFEQPGPERRTLTTFAFFLFL